MTTTTTQTPTIPPCPDWCDPTAHGDDPEADGSVTRYHRSQSIEVKGFGTFALTHTVRAGRVDPLAISISPGGWADLESP
jgi:hypothetical protein